MFFFQALIFFSFLLLSYILSLLSFPAYILTVFKLSLHTLKCTDQDFPEGPVAQASHSQCRETRLSPWSGSWILHPTKSLHASRKIRDPMLYNEDPVQPNK